MCGGDVGHMLILDKPDGTIEILRADDEIYVTDEFLDCARYQWVSFGDGIMTVHASNGDVSYGLYAHDPQRAWWRGRRSGPV